MESGIFDKNGIEISIGDTIVFPYMNPVGEIEENTPDFTAVVKFKFGCFGYFNQVEFVPLFEWMGTLSGEYVPNHGNKTVYTNEYPFWVEN